VLRSKTERERNCSNANMQPVIRWIVRDQTQQRLVSACEKAEDRDKPVDGSKDSEVISCRSIAHRGCGQCSYTAHNVDHVMRRIDVENPQKVPILRYSGHKTENTHHQKNDTENVCHRFHHTYLHLNYRTLLPVRNASAAVSELLLTLQCELYEAETLPLI
jgi:hypothetical protein